MAGEAKEEKTDFVLKHEGSRRILVIDYRNKPFGADIIAYPQAMRNVIERLEEVDADEVVLSEYYERIYNEEQTRILKGVADLVGKLEADAVWSPSKLGKTAESKIISERHNKVLIIVNLIYEDPFRAYLELIGTIKNELAKARQLEGEAAADEEVYLSTLKFIKDSMDATELIQRMKRYLSELGEIPNDRSIYHSLFEVAIKPSFIGSRIFFSGTESLELINQYEVTSSKVFIYKHPEKVEYLYYLQPPEYDLPPEKYFLLEKTKEVVAAHRPGSVSFMDIGQARRYFKKIYSATISDIANKNGIALTAEEREDLAVIVSRYTIGYGILEIFLSDRQITDIYIDSPLGNKPIYLVHSKYGQCQTNVVYSEEEAKALVSRFRALSGRPFDEAHPILDFDLADLETRIAVIGKPLALDGTAFAFRLHKTTPWTLPQFVDQKMFSSFYAGMLSFFVDAQASMLIVGSRGAGKTSMLQAMMLEIPQNLRIIVQEDTQELPIPALKKLNYNVQRLKTRPPLGAQSEAEVSAEDALRTALRLGDSVLIVGEVRSTEARALYEAMRVGAVGNVVMGTIHGESAYSIWDRVVNDLGVPTTSFKATDFAIVSAPIRFQGSLKRSRRLIEITEVKKEWNEDPLREDGFLQWATFDANKDDMEFFKNKMKDSPWLEKVSRIRGLSFDAIWDEINARGNAKQILVDLKNKYNIPDLLEAQNTVKAHVKYMLLEERQRDEYGSIDYDRLLADYLDWVKQVLVQPLLPNQPKQQG
ncbi:MAG: type II/IV secretion system ATPase subunit [Candidatus Micrarchaeia archaeon]|jgi:type IV secretory pathway ATPase VirB11/archaellum biosynthesis ATPase